MEKQKKQVEAQKPKEDKTCKRCGHSFPLSNFNTTIRKHKLVSGCVKTYTYYVPYCKPCEVTIVMSYRKNYNPDKQAAAFKRWKDKKKKLGLNPNQRPLKK
jgi:hypothetical protein